MPRQARLDAPGTLHHVIVRGIENRRIVDDRKDKENFLERLANLLPETQMACYGWVLIGNPDDIFSKRKQPKKVKGSQGGRSSDISVDSLGNCGKRYPMVAILTSKKPI